MEEHNKTHAKGIAAVMYRFDAFMNSPQMLGTVALSLVMTALSTERFWLYVLCYIFAMGNTYLFIGKVFAEISQEKRLEKVRKTLGWTGGGVNKRIDENWELLELLQREAPEFMEKHPWVRGWFRSHDDFFQELTKNVDVKEGPFVELTPRPAPSSK